MKFTYNPRIIKQLGTELITSDSIALSELIKNSYDAKARNVNIQFLDTIGLINSNELIAPIPDIVKNEIESLNSNLILVEDDGSGMDYEKLQKGFFEIGSDIKEINKNQKDSDEVVLGNKGIGRLSAQRLSPILFVETVSLRKNGESESNLVKIEWGEVEKNNEAEAQNWTFSTLSNNSYTRLWLVGGATKIDFDKFFTSVVEQDKDLFGNSYGLKKQYYKINEELLSTLNFLYSPFEGEYNPLKLRLTYNTSVIKANFNKDNLAIAEAQHSFSLKCQKENESLRLNLNMTILPWFIQRIHYGMIGDKLYQDYKKESSFYKSLQEKYAQKYKTSLEDEILIEDYVKKQLKKEKIFLTEIDTVKEIKEITSHLKEISPITGCIYSFKREKKMLEMAYDSAIENHYIAKDSKLNDIKSFLDAYNGVKLYRNGFRIATLGNKSSDWLKLQQKRTTGQQFYRFELGNALGYVKINDPKQEHIFETSSREDITDKPHKKALANLLDYIFNDRFYALTRNAVEITKDILDEEGLIPKNTQEEIEKESESAKDLLSAAEKNLKAFSEAFNIIRENKDLDSEDKINTVKALLDSVDNLAQNLDGSLKNSFKALKSTDTLLAIAKEEKRRIEIETYNNYKLMANGLVTEVITHELHSLIQDKDSHDYEDKIDIVKKYLFEQDNPSLYKDNLYPVRKRLEAVSNKLSDIQQFYNFLEKTFVYSGKAEDFESQNLKEFLVSLVERNQSRLNKYKIKTDFTGADGVFNIPRGAFMHIFYNLIDNSIYWIGERQAKSVYDKTFYKDEDKITVRIKNDNTIQYFDSGTGVLDRIQYVLFQPMTSGKDNGRGMGLYIIRKFLSSFDAKIELLDDLNQFGNRYIFEITFNSQFENK